MNASKIGQFGRCYDADTCILDPACQFYGEHRDMTLSFHKVQFDAQEVLDLAQDCATLNEFTERFTGWAEQRSRYRADDADDGGQR